MRYFQTVAECGSYSRGSELLRISQPAVSRAIRNLEEELGRPLFKRHGHGVSLTEAGVVLLERSQATLRQLEQTAEEIRSGGSGPAGVVSIALPPAAGRFIAPMLVESIARDFPNIFLRMVGGFSGYIHEWLIRGQVDLACVHDPLPQRGFEVTPLLREEVFAVGKAGAFPTDADLISTSDLVQLPLILPSRPNASRRLLDSWTAQSGVLLQPEIEVDDHTITRSLVKNGQGFSLLTKGAFAGDLARGEVEARSLTPTAYWSLAAVSCQRTPRSDLIAELVNRLRQVVRAQYDSGSWSGEVVENRTPEVRPLVDDD